MADAEAQQPVQPDSLFRWCSISKTITAAAVMRLVEETQLDLDRPVFGILDQFAPYNGKWGDSRLASITVRQLLQHTGGWDRATSQLFDPVTAEGSLKVSQATGTAFPPSIDTVIRYMLAERLDFTPGSRFAYSNFGYELVGRIVEKISGQSYDARMCEGRSSSPSAFSDCKRAIPTWPAACPAKSGTTIIRELPSSTRISRPRAKACRRHMASSIPNWKIPPVHGLAQ